MLAKNPREEGHSCPAPLPSPEGALRTPHPAPSPNTPTLCTFFGRGQYTLDFLAARDANANSVIASHRTNIMSSPIQLQLCF